MRRMDQGWISKTQPASCYLMSSTWTTSENPKRTPKNADILFRIKRANDPLRIAPEVPATPRSFQLENNLLSTEHNQYLI